MAAVVDRFEVHPVAVPLDHPYRDATRVETHSRDVYVRLGTTDGAEGWGAGTPRHVPTGETQVGTVHVLEHVIRDVVLGANLDGHEAVGRAIAGAIPGNEAAKTAVELAVHDLLARRAGRSVAAMLGVPKRTELPTLDILPIEPPDRMAELALELRERIGTERFKLKIDADVAAGLERVAAVRAALPEAMLVVDANGAWDVATARSAVEKLARYQVAVVEQPVPGHRVDELAAVRRDSPIPIAADESARPEFVDWLIATRACDLVNLKITREGGFRPALAVAESARAAGIQVIVGSVVQTGLVDAACAHLFAVLPEVAYNESGKAPAWHPRDVVTGLDVADGVVRLPAGPGLGVTVDEEALATFRPRD